VQFLHPAGHQIILPTSSDREPRSNSDRQPGSSSGTGSGRSGKQPRKHKAVGAGPSDKVKAVASGCDGIVISDSIHLQWKGWIADGLARLTCVYAHRATPLALHSRDSRWLLEQFLQAPGAILLYSGQGPATHALAMHKGQLFFHSLSTTEASIAQGVPSIEHSAGGRVQGYRTAALRAIMHDYRIGGRPVRQDTSPFTSTSQSPTASRIKDVEGKTLLDLRTAYAVRPYRSMCMT